MASPLALFGLDVASVIRDAVKALVDIVVPDFGADWTSHVVTWLVALPDVSGPQFPALNRYAHDLTAVGFGLLGATTIAGGLQLWAGGLTGARGGAEALRRAVLAAGVLVSYPALMHTVTVGTNILTAAMIRNPQVVGGLDKAFGEALIASAITSGVSLGLAVGAAFTLLYFLAALFVLKIGLTAALAVTTIGGALVWGLYPLPQAMWLARAWTSALVAALSVPVAWACIFAAAALLASDTLVFDARGAANDSLGPDLAELVKPFAAVACFWLAYKAPSMLLAVSRAAGVAPSLSGVRAAPGGGPPAGGGRSPELMVRRGMQANADRFRAIGARAVPPATAAGARVIPARGRPAPGSAHSPAPARSTGAAAMKRPKAAQTPRGAAAAAGSRPAPAKQNAPAKRDRAGATAKTMLAAPRRANDAWRALADEGRALRTRQSSPPTTRQPAGGAASRPAPSQPPAPRTQAPRPQKEDRPAPTAPRTTRPAARPAPQRQPARPAATPREGMPRTDSRPPAARSPKIVTSRAPARPMPPPRRAVSRPTRKQPRP